MRFSNRSIAYSVLIAFTFIASACGKKAELAGSGTGSSTSPTPSPTPSASPSTSPSPSPTPGITAPLRVTVDSVWERSSLKFTQKVCTVLTGTPTGGADIPCDVHVPEAQLFFSDLNFTIEGAPNSCDLIFFQPYYYRASQSATFLPRWGTAPIDCSAAAAADLADCYNGPATELVPEFPKYRGLYMVPNNIGGTTSTFKVSSANSKLRGSHNRWASNDILTSAIATGIPEQSGDGVVANSFVDYSATCVDKYGERLYSFKIKIIDDNTPAGGTLLDQYRDWRSPAL